MAKTNEKSQEVEDNTRGRAKKGGFSVGPANLPDGTHRRKGRFQRMTLDQKRQVLTASSTEDQERSYTKSADQEIICQSEESGITTGASSISGATPR